MAEKEGPYFGRLVLGCAAQNTKRAFESRLRDSVIGGVSTLAGFGFYRFRYGLPVAMQQIAPVLAFTFGPIGIVVVVVFLWNLWIAPAELAYAEFEKSHTSYDFGLQKSPFTNKVTWSVWQKRDQFTITEAAALLAKEDPSSTQISNEASAVTELLLEAARSNKLPFIKRFNGGPNYTKYELPITKDHTRIIKKELFDWAKKNNFDVGHIEDN